MTRCRHSWRGLDTITAITRDVGDPFQYVHNALKHQVFRLKDSWDRIWDDTVLDYGQWPSNRDNHFHV